MGSFPRLSGRGGSRDCWFPALALVLAVVLLAACSRADPTPIATAPAVAYDNLPEKEASTVVRPEEGGTVGLRSGARLGLPRDSVVQPVVVVLRMVEDTPTVPAPHSVIGQVYEFTIEGGELTGIGMLTLPVPGNLSADQYDIAPYRWNGRSWERLPGRLTEDGVRAGVDRAALYAVLGAWKMADATMSVTVPPFASERQGVPVEVSGEYRYSAPPLLQHEYAEAQLTLKSDSSGGAGRVTGDETVDQTIAETTLWFKPDAAESGGVIQFVHTFELSPQMLDVPLGSVVQLYAVLTVVDSAAPTRRFSASAEYTQVVPIQVMGSEVVRPELAPESVATLRWHVRLNGGTLFVRPALETSLSLAEALALGGLGEYRVMLEVETEGEFIPVSNEVVVRLALPVTETPPPPPSATAPGGQPGTPQPEGQVPPTVPAFGTMPPTPTRRTPPQGAVATALPGTPSAGGTPSPIAGTPTPTLTPTPTRPQWARQFYADSYELPAGGCTTLHWTIENIASITLDNAATTSPGEKRVCIDRTTTFTLKTTDRSGNTQERRVTISVPATPEPNAITFRAERYQIREGECTTLHWRATGVESVQLNDGQTSKGVVGEPTTPESVCPTANTVYTLEVRKPSETVLLQINIQVVPAETIPIRFWAEQYTLRPGACTTLWWSVQEVQAVYLTINGQERDVPGEYREDPVCPTGTAEYALRVVANDGHAETQRLRIEVADAEPGGLQVIAQGIARQVRWVNDFDSSLAGEQSGWEILADGVSPLYAPGGGCCEPTVRLQVRQEQVSDPHDMFLDWPIAVGEYIEFRANCVGSQCALDEQAPYYLKHIR